MPKAKSKPINWAQKGKNYSGSKTTPEGVAAAKKAASERTASYNERMRRQALAAKKGKK